jgi:hypothetical protein
LTDPERHPYPQPTAEDPGAQSNQTLFNTEKTTSVRARHLLTKLESPVRGEAGAIAHRLDLDQR